MEQTTMQIIRELISNLGFPIAMCVYFIWDKTRCTAETNKILAQMSETLVVIKDYIEREKE